MWRAAAVRIKPRAPLPQRAGVVRSDVLHVLDHLGFCVDSVHLRAGVFALLGEPRFPFLRPPWLVALWALFGTTLRGSLGWLAGRYRLSAALGAVGGALSYVGGTKLGAVTLGRSPIPRSAPPSLPSGSTRSAATPI
jgi:hypothetical protein